MKKIALFLFAILITLTAACTQTISDTFFNKEITEISIRNKEGEHIALSSEETATLAELLEQVEITHEPIIPNTPDGVPSEFKVTYGENTVIFMMNKTIYEDGTEKDIYIINDVCYPSDDVKLNEKLRANIRDLSDKYW